MPACDRRDRFVAGAADWTLRSAFRRRVRDESSCVADES